MIRYSSYGATNFRPPSAPTDLDPLKAKYRELLELRERVKAAEEAGSRSRARRSTGPLPARRSGLAMIAISAGPENARSLAR
jgi:hypothetical protein